MIEGWAKALVLAPHTDDGELGCGGTMARLVEAGCTGGLHGLGEEKCILVERIIERDAQVRAAVASQERQRQTGRGRRASRSRHR